MPGTIQRSIGAVESAPFSANGAHLPANGARLPGMAPQAGPRRSASYTAGATTLLLGLAAAAVAADRRLVTAG